jgi:subtilisin family serine protease
MPTSLHRNATATGTRSFKVVPVINPCELVGLLPLMERTEGRPDLLVSVIDGPVSLAHPAFVGRRIREIAAGRPPDCHQPGSVACAHGTLVLGVLASARGYGAPGICPGCTFIVRPIFAEETSSADRLPVASPEELARAVSDSIAAGARVINLSAALTDTSLEGEPELTRALSAAAHHQVLVVAAAGNQGEVSTSSITRHPWVIPVIATDTHGVPMDESNLARSIGRHGLAAPGENIESIGSAGSLTRFSGTSAATPFVTGTVALLWSEFPRATAAEIRQAVLMSGGKRTAIAPPLLDAWAAFRLLIQRH